MTNLELRIVSAVALAVPALALTWLGDIWFRILMAAMGAVILAEWAMMSGHSGSLRRVAVPAVAMIVLLVMLVIGLSAWQLLVAAAIGVALVFADARMRGDPADLALAFAYAALSALALALLRGADTAGLWAILFLFAVVWATDILAYFVGRALGGPKLAPSISPGKTWSGAVGGAVGGTVAGSVVALLAGASGVWFVPVALLLSATSQIGDLFESAVKRRYGVKDSSRLIPGHGGMMDRIDGLVAAAVILYVIGAGFAGLDFPSAGLFAP
ncbi:MAG: phosphatidate cytidylyltransferase [Rhizobiaceae bacterium]